MVRETRKWRMGMEERACGWIHTAVEGSLRAAVQIFLGTERRSCDGIAA